MRSSQLVVIAALSGVAFVSEPSASARAAEVSARQRAVVLFKEPVVVGGTFLMGRVMIVHDQDRKDRGEPCTQFYQLSEGKQPQELVAVHCKRVARPVAERLTLDMRAPDINYKVLTSYQFAGADHAHQLLAGHLGH